MIRRNRKLTTRQGEDYTTLLDVLEINYVNKKSLQINSN